MLNNYYTLVHLSREFDSLLCGAKISQASTQMKHTLEILFETGHGTVKLTISCLPQNNFIYLEHYLGRRLRGANVLPEIAAKTPTKVGVLSNERQLYIEFSDRIFLRVNLFGSSANVYVTDAEGIIINSFLKPSEKVAKKLTIAGNPVGFPSDVADLCTRYSNAVGDHTRRLSKCIPTVDSMLAREIAYRYDLSHGTSGGAADIDFDLLQDILTTIHEELLAASPRIYFAADSNGHDTNPAAFGLIELKHLQSEKFKRYSSINECVHDSIIYSGRSKKSFDTRADMMGALNRKISSIRRTLMKMESDLANTREERYRSFGEYIMSHLGDIKQGDKMVSMDENVTEIELNPALTPVRNAQAYFDKSKHARQAKKQTEQRKIEMTRELNQTEDLLKQVEQEEDVKVLDSMKKDRILPEKNEQRSPFREFEKNGYKIFVGKDAKNNDNLTFGYAKPNDIFLHARGVSGSHVIIKNPTREFPQKPVLQYAASIAAHYSKARTSRIVPVAYTMRKFVKKAKGEPGAVLIDREEVIYVKPEIPI